MFEKIIVKQLIKKFKEVAPEKYPLIKKKLLEQILSIKNDAKSQGVEGEIVLLSYVNSKSEIVGGIYVMDAEGNLCKKMSSFNIDDFLNIVIHSESDTIIEIFENVKL